MGDEPGQKLNPADYGYDNFPNDWPDIYYDMPKECPVKDRDYSITSTGSYGFQSVVRRCVPFMGEAWAEKVKPPDTATGQNVALDHGIQATMASAEQVGGKANIKLWQDMNKMLAELNKLSAILGQYLATPLKTVLMYLTAGIFSLTLLVLGLVIGL